MLIFAAQHVQEFHYEFVSLGVQHCFLFKLFLAQGLVLGVFIVGIVIPGVEVISFRLAIVVSDLDLEKFVKEKSD